MKIKGLNIAIVSLACLTVIALAGSSVGTLAWYAYSTRATVAYSGTAVQKAEQLQIGLEWDASLYPIDETIARTYKDTYEASFSKIGNKTYCFMAPGSGFSSLGISRYLFLHGYATNEIPPVTSNSYDYGQDLGLYESPTYGYPDSVNTAAKARYVKLPFAFRIQSTSSGTSAYVGDQKIWLTDVTAATDEDANGRDVKDALRIHVKNQTEKTIADEERQFILHPTAEEDGSTPVAGLLDLNKDGFYDYGDQKINNVTKSVEYIYGGHTIKNDRQPARFETTTFENINNVAGATSMEQSSTFVAQHHEGVYGYSGYTDIDRKVAKYYSFNDIKPHENNSNFSDGVPIAYTSSDTGVGLCTLTVWLEGWDHAIIDKNIGAKFNLGLQFEINRV